MNQHIETLQMFSIPLGVTKMPSEICNQMKSYKGMIQSQMAKNKKELNFNILKTLPDVKKSITYVFSLWINNVMNTPDQKWKMTTNWITENPYGEPMVRHRHFNCAYSGVLYFEKIDMNQGKLVFENPIPQLDFFTGYEHQSATIFNKQYCEVFPKEQMMLFFPANLNHYYDSFKIMKKYKIRKSFACNFIPIGKFGVGDSTFDTDNWSE